MVSYRKVNLIIQAHPSAMDHDGEQAQSAVAAAAHAQGMIIISLSHVLLKM